MIPAHADTPVLTERLADALGFALDAHSTQLRKGTDVPYFAHLLAVTALVLEMGGTEDEAIAGALHDTLEDAPDPDIRSRVQERFGDRVLSLVGDVSETEGEWEQRKRSYLDHLAECPPGALRVGLADKLHNARSTWRLPAKDRWARFNRGREQQQWWYESLATAFEARLGDDGQLSPFVAELRGIVTEMFA